MASVKLERSFYEIACGREVLPLPLFVEEDLCVPERLQSSLNGPSGWDEM